MKTSGLFAGIGGIELGLKRTGHSTSMLCEIDPGAQAVLRHHFPDVPLVQDVRKVHSFPSGTELVTAGFPCQDLSQVGATNGINGSKSGVVAFLFRLLEQNDIPNVLIENVPFMLHLHKGFGIQYIVESLEAMGYNWAYRVVDALCFGLPQRRERVYLLASKEFEPWNVLFRDDAGAKGDGNHAGLACGFYWTEGTRGLGWAVDAIPTLKGGSTLGIPSPPAIWLPNGRIVKPHLRDAERLQGFPPDWTKPAESAGKKGYRWKLVGNAVSVKVAEWIGECISRMSVAARIELDASSFKGKQAWPCAAFGSKQLGRMTVNISKWPVRGKRIHLADFLIEDPEDLSLRATTGFLNRLKASKLYYPDDFYSALLLHQKHMQEGKEDSRAPA